MQWESKTKLELNSDHADFAQRDKKSISAKKVRIGLENLGPDATAPDKKSLSSNPRRPPAGSKCLSTGAEECSDVAVIMIFKESAKYKIAHRRNEGALRQ